MFALERRARPIVKWAGSKSNCLSRLVSCFPGTFGRYIEPFVGSGAVFLALSPEVPVLLNDANQELMAMYRAIRDRPLDLMLALDKLGKEYSEDFYYRLRDQPATEPVAAAARFIFLNKTCFNGLYRTNSRGEFNVPFGKRKRCPALYERAVLLEVAFRLRGAQIFCTDFEAVVDSAERGDLVYCDPPYLPSSDTACFSEYTPGGFGWEDHIRLREASRRAAERGAHVVISNSAVPFIREFYSGWSVDELEVPRRINAKADRRGLVRDVVVRPTYGSALSMPAQRPQ
jgi:DNA adenine methylase